MGGRKEEGGREKALADAVSEWTSGVGGDGKKGWVALTNHSLSNGFDRTSHNIVFLLICHQEIIEETKDEERCEEGADHLACNVQEAGHGAKLLGTKHGEGDGHGWVKVRRRDGSANVNGDGQSQAPKQGAFRQRDRGPKKDSISSEP